MFGLATALILLTATAPRSQAITLVTWTFETSLPSGTGTTSASYLPETNNTGVATDFASCTPGGGSAADFNSPAGNGSTHSFNADTWGTGGYFQLTVSTVGYMGLSVSYDQAGSNGTGPRDFSLSYSTTGTGGMFSLVPGSAYQNSALAFNSTAAKSALSHSFDLSGIFALEDNANVVFRITETDAVAIGGGAVTAGGMDRIDNFLVTGTASTPVPEPTTVFGGLLLAGIACWHLRGLLPGFLPACRKA